jgi:hypothetical protein
MTGHINRRAALGASSGAGNPARRLGGRSRGPVHPDAPLLAMGPAIDAADMELDAALDGLKAADEAYFDKEPDMPAKPSGPVFSDAEQQAIDAMAALMRERRGPSPESAAYNQGLRTTSGKSNA